MVGVEGNLAAADLSYQQECCSGPECRRIRAKGVAGNRVQDFGRGLLAECNRLSYNASYCVDSNCKSTRQRRYSQVFQTICRTERSATSDRAPRYLTVQKKVRVGNQRRP
jgi:hypothetical protein